MEASMSIAEAKAEGLRQWRRGRLWPMPVRETDLGHIHAGVTIRATATARKKWAGRMLVDTGATDTFVPGSVLRRLGIKPAGKREYELADGTWQDLRSALA